MISVTSNGFTTFPRVCGGDPVSTSSATSFVALFPVYAGVILAELERVAEALAFPRVCGGDPG